MRISLYFFLLVSLSVFGQKTSYAAFNIPDSLKQNANAVMRLEQINIDITSQRSMTISSIKAITVLNEMGLRNMHLGESYDKNRRINKITATAYDAFGKELKVYKRKDFRDNSVVDGISVFNDNRILYLDYTPIAYPFTMVLETEIETSNTAFIPDWSPVENYLVSTETTSLTINYKTELHLKSKEVNFSKAFPIEKKETAAMVSYTAKNLIAKKREELSPDFSEIFPVVYFALENFQLENVEGTAVDWSGFGKWMYQSLLADTEEIPEETIQKIKQLVGNEKDPVAIARIVYKYVQEKTRYVSIQVGIGGWKPMLAKDVDKLGYGDCKALTNYTRCLLKKLGIEAYYTVVYSGAERKNIRKDIASIQGDHIILALPTAKEMLWLECTSQIMPFGFQGDFTDDRDVLVVKPEGGEIVKTKLFTENENEKTTKGSYEIAADGNFSGKVKMVSKGLEYDNEFAKERLSRENQVKRYKEEFGNINNLSVKQILLNNNQNNIEFTEDLLLEAEGYAQKSGENKLIFALNAFDQNGYVPQKNKARQFPFEIKRGYTNEDETEISIPDGFSIEAKPNGIEQNTEFGTYKIEFTVLSPTKILCKRKLVIRKGLYDKNKYEDFRKFRETIAKNDNSKIVITKA